MTKSLRLPAVAGLACLWAAAALADGPHGRPGDQRPPAGVIHVSAGGENLILWPYTTSDFETSSDPINLIFPNADPREIRQELLNLDGNRLSSDFAGYPSSDCRWTDAMGNEQAAFVRPERWVGGAVQLACAPAGRPLGDPVANPFRFHVRLFRSGTHTVGAAHYEMLIPGTAEHEALSWDYARDFVAYDLSRTGRLLGDPEEVPVIPGGSFRSVRRAVYGPFVAAVPALAPFFENVLGLDPSVPGDLPIPTSGKALAFATAIDLEGRRTHTVTTTQVTYSITVPKPFCATGPYDFAKLEGPLQFIMSVTTSPSGRYERAYTLGGTLQVTPMVPTSPTTFVAVGPPVPAPVHELHRATLDDRYDQVTEQAQQTLLRNPVQALAWSFAAGDTDRFVRSVVCGAE